MTNETSIKTASRKTAAAPGTRFEWSDYLRATPDLKARQRLADNLRAAGITLDAVGHPNNTAIVAAAVTSVEDWLELERPSETRTQTREALRTIRRSLEARCS